MKLDPGKHNELVGLIAVIAFASGLVFASLPTVSVHLPLLMEGAANTIAIVLPALALAAALSIVVGAALLSHHPAICVMARLYVEVCRGISLPVQLFWLFFVLPHFGIRLPAEVVAILALGLDTGAYGAEVVRGGLQGVPKSQVEAAIALSLPTHVRFLKITLPQALIAITPSAINLAVEALKGSALVSLITITDLTFQGRAIIERTYKPLEVYSIIMVLYMLMAAFIIFIGRLLEAHLPGRNIEFDRKANT